MPLKFCLFFLTCCLFYACDKGPRVDVPFRTYVTIPAGLNTGFSHHFVVRDIPGATFDNLLEAKPAYVTLEVDYGENNLDFIQQAFFYTVKDGQRKEMAYQDALPLTNASVVQLYPSILEMKDHITQDKFEMELKVIFRAIPVTETRLRIDFGVQGLLGE